MKVTGTSISVLDLRIHACHGVDEQERIVGNDFSVDVDLVFDARAAMQYDDLAATVNYAQVTAIVRDVMQKPSLLIENVVWRIIEALTSAFPIVESGTVTVTKLHPPVAAEMQGASFTASFTR